MRFFDGKRKKVAAQLKLSASRAKNSGSIVNTKMLKKNFVQLKTYCHQFGRNVNTNGKEKMFRNFENFNVIDHRWIFQGFVSINTPCILMRVEPNQAKSPYFFSGGFNSAFFLYPIKSRILLESFP